MQKKIIILCLSVINLYSMQQPIRQIPNNDVGVTLETIISRYKNPVRVILAEVIYEKDRMADDCPEQYTFKTMGTVKELLKIAAGATATCRIPIPMLTVGSESRACLLIEDETSTFYDDQYANVWLAKFSGPQETFFHCPKIEGTKQACDPDSLIGVSLELYDKNSLKMRNFHHYYVNVSSRIVPQADQ